MVFHEIEGIPDGVRGGPRLLPGVEIQPVLPEPEKQVIYINADEQLIIPRFALPSEREEVY